MLVDVDFNYLLLNFKHVMFLSPEFLHSWRFVFVFDIFLLCHLLDIDESLVEQGKNILGHLLLLP